MPGTAAALGLDDPFDPRAAIDAQAHLMRDLLRRFGSVPLALAAYNAGSAPVAACRCIPPYPETRAYVTKILGLLGGVGDIAPPNLDREIGRVKRNRPGTSLFNALNPSGGCMTRAARQAAARRGGCRLWVLGGGNHGRNLRTLLSG